MSRAPAAAFKTKTVCVLLVLRVIVEDALEDGKDKYYLV